MLLSRTAEYALRGVACLAQADGEPLTAEMISEVASIPAHYVSKVMRQLVVAGLVKGRRGRQGGFTLGRRPDEIRFADVLDAVSENIDPERCAFGQPRCNPSQPCPLHPAWERLQEDFARWAGTSTFAP